MKIKLRAQAYPTALLFRTKTLLPLGHSKGGSVESVVTRIILKDLISSSAYWGFEITSSGNRE